MPPRSLSSYDDAYFDVLRTHLFLPRSIVIPILSISSVALTEIITYSPLQDTLIFTWNLLSIPRASCHTSYKIICTQGIPPFALHILFLQNGLSLGSSLQRHVPGLHTNHVLMHFSNHVGIIAYDLSLYSVDILTRILVTSTTIVVR